MDDVNAYIEIIKENIEYDHYMKYGDKQNRELYDELFEIICEVYGNNALQCTKHNQSLLSTEGTARYVRRRMA